MTADDLKDAISSRGFCYASKGAEENSSKIYIDLYSGIVTQANKFGNDEITDLSRNGRSNFDWLVWLGVEHNFIFDDYHNDVLKSLNEYIKNPKQEIESLNVEDLFAQFDLDAIGKSTIKYYQAILDLSNALLDHLQKLENISPNTESMQKLKLTPEDIRGQIKDVRNKVENLKSQADQFFIQLDEVNNSPNSIPKLAELESMLRPSFEFIVENFANIINKLSIHNLK